MEERDVFQAIADPTRRKIIDLLAGNALSVSEVAGHFDISRPAVSKHLKVLREAGLLEVKKDGRRRICRSDPTALREVMEWADQYRSYWNTRLDKLKEILLKEDQRSRS